MQLSKAMVFSQQGRELIDLLYHKEGSTTRKHHSGRRQPMQVPVMRRLSFGASKLGMWYHQCAVSPVERCMINLGLL